ncbi:uncharacterized protein LOC124427589 [Vespa crabro]|uniref:uncharacterized protein LOC124427589 n=1 Tax=Vespa crabro TaxID=7445 RepID=UPI001F01CE36|nr:uncharacterized protein LOC124427589 [Vespa crabro]
MLVDVKDQDKEISCMIEKIPKGLLCRNTLTLSSRHFIPYIDSSSWLYLDPNPIFHVARPATCSQYLEYAMPPPKRKIHRRHHHHHHHCRRRRRHRHERHRRVMSDPGKAGTCNSLDNLSQPKQRRRGFSFSEYIDDVPAPIEQTSAIHRWNGEDKILPSEETSASTFRKVPWHPNLHMLKIRRT